MARATLKSLALLLALTVLFYWKILFTTQFTVFADTESVHQLYAWLHFWISSLQNGSLPLWDPYTFSGHSFIGEMQNAPFYPLHLLMALVPLGNDPWLLARVYECWYVFSHFLGACFMFALIRELGLRRFAALVAALAFALGGFLSIAAWAYIYESSTWLPVILLFLLRALKAGDTRRALRNAAFSGLALGLSVLAGGMHIVIMEAIVVVAAAAYAAFHRTANRRWTLPALAVAAIAVVAFCASAIQLFPSVEYGRVALRRVNGGLALPPTQKIPYAWLTDNFYYWPHGIVGLLIPRAFGGKPFGASLGQAAVMPVYLGVFPFLAALIGIWKCWSRPWVRFFAGLALAAFCYALGPLSLLHGLSYALIPGLWTAREADRFIFLTYFALAVLSAFGVEALFGAEETGDTPGRSSTNGAPSQGPQACPRFLLVGTLILCAVLLIVPAVYTQLSITPLVSLSILLIAATCGLLLYIGRGHTGLLVKALIVALILFDLSAFSSPAVNKIEAAAKGTNELDRLLSMQGAADFVKSQPGLFRVQVLADPRPNPGDAFEIQTLLGAGVTMVKDYFEIHPRADLLNARYIIRPASAPEPGSIYQDAAWKVYENPGAYPRAWIVHETAVGTLEDAGADPRKVALLSEPLETDLQPAAAPESANVSHYEAKRMEIDVHTAGRAMLVLSENYYPGWSAAVNGQPARIYKVDGALRGILVPPGDSRVELHYAPASILAGAILSLAAFLAVAFFAWRGAGLRPAA